MYLCTRPRQLYFGCIKESNYGGGETSLADFRKVYQDLDPAVRQKFLCKGVLYNRTHGLVGDKWSTDVGARLSWPQMFGTSDKKEVETICREEDSPEVICHSPFDFWCISMLLIHDTPTRFVRFGLNQVQWVGPKKDTFYQEWTDDATQLHPDTKEKVWFNHAQVRLVLLEML